MNCPEAILKVRASSALGTDIVKTPNAVQQNVPDWSLFGIFFIVLPYLLLLPCFALTCIAVAWLFFFRRIHN